MPQIVEVDGVGEVEFDDGMSLDDIKVAIERDILPRFQQPNDGVRRAVPVEPSTQPPPTDTSLSDLARRIPAGISQSTADAAAGLMQVGQDVANIPGQLGVDLQRIQQSSALQTALENMGTPAGTEAYREYLRTRKGANEAQQAVQENVPLQPSIEFARDVSARSASDYGVDPARDQQFLSQVASGAGSLVTAMGSGPLAPVTMAGMMAESGRREAEEAGATPAQQRSAFYANAAVGALSQALMGVPALLRSARRMRIPDNELGAMVRSAAAQAIKSAGREGTQESIEQMAQNIIASDIAAYAPERSMWSGVPEAFKLGATLGAPTGAVVQTAQNIDAQNAQQRRTVPDAVAGIIRADGSAEFLDGSRMVQPIPSEGAPSDPDVELLSRAAAEATPAPPDPLQQASAQLLGQDLNEIQQQEALISGQPVPLPSLAELEGRQIEPVTEEVTEEVVTPTEEAVVDEVATEPELITPEGLTALEPDSFERLADQPVQEGFRALQDQETFDVFQVPQNATPEQIEAARQQARQEGEQLARQYEFEEQRRIRQEEFERGQREVQELQSITRRGQQQQPATPQPEFRNLWDNPENLKRILDQQEQNLKRAQAGTLRDPSGQPVTTQQLESGVQALRDRYQELTGKQQAAKTAAKGMKRGKRGEQGSTTIPQAVTEFAEAIYREGVQFKDWSRQMLRSLGQNIRPFLQDIWNSLTRAVNALSPSQRARVETRMQRRDFSEGGTFGGAGGARFRQAQEQGRTFTGPEGKPRYEIDDSNMEVVMNLRPGQSAKLGDVIQHDELFDSYPQARDINVEVKTGALGAAYSKAGNKITIYDPLGKGIDNSLFYSRALVHEIQHYLQGIEGFATGGSIREWNRDQIRDEIEYTGDELRSVVDSDFKSPQEAQQHRRRLEDKLDVLGKAYRAKGGTDYYNRLAGEFEARDVANRLDMTAEERAQTTPYSSEEVPAGGLIVNTRPSLMSALEPEGPATPPTPPSQPSPEPTPQPDDNRPRRQVFGRKEGERYNPVRIAEIQERVRREIFNGNHKVTKAQTTRAKNLAYAWASDSRAVTAEMAKTDPNAPTVAKTELFRYATEMAAQGDPSLQRFLLANDSQMGEITMGLVGSASDAGLTLRLRRLMDHPLWKAVQEVSQQAEKEAAAIIGDPKVDPAIQALKDRLAELNLTPEQALDALNSINDLGGQNLQDILNKLVGSEQAKKNRKKRQSNKPTPEEEQQDKETEQAQEEADAAQSEADNLAERTASQILNRFEQSQTEWLKPDAEINAVRQIINGELKGQFPLPDERSKWGTYINPLRDRLIEAGVSESTAASLALETYGQVKAVRATRTWKAAEAARKKAERISELKAKRDAARAARSANAPTDTALSILEKFEQSQTEWVRPDSPRNQIRELINNELRGQAPLPDPNNAWGYIRGLSDRLVQLGVRRQEALRLAQATYDQLIARRSAIRQKAMQDAFDEGNVQPIIDAILETPMAERTGDWIKRTTEQFFEEAGLPPDLVQAATRVFSREIEAKFRQAADRALQEFVQQSTPWSRKLNSPKKAERTRAQRDLEKIRKAVRVQATDPSRTMTAELAKENGWVGFSDADHKRMAEIDHRLSAPDMLPTEQVKLQNELFNIVRKAKLPSTVMDALAESYNASALSSLGTIGVNLYGPVGEVMGQYMTFNAAAMLPGGGGIDQIIYNTEQLVKSIATMPRNMRYSATNDVYMLNENEVMMRGNALLGLLERAKADWNSGNAVRMAKALPKIMYGSMDFVRRAFNILDDTNFRAMEQYYRALYGSQAMRRVGHGTEQIRALAAAAQSVYQHGYQSGVAMGMSQQEASMRGRDMVREAYLHELGQLTDTQEALDVEQAAKQDALLALGRNDGQLNEGFLSELTGLNRWHGYISELRSTGNWFQKIWATIYYGFVRTPFQLARYGASYTPYGTFRYALHQYRRSKNLPTFWQQSMGTDAQARQRLIQSIGGQLAMALMAQFVTGSNDDDRRDGIKVVITGNGPGYEDPAFRDAWLKEHKPAAIEFYAGGKRRAVIQYGRGPLEGLAWVFSMLGAVDDYRLKHGQKTAMEREDQLNAGIEVATSYITSGLQRGALAGGRNSFQSFLKNPSGSTAGVAGAAGYAAAPLLPAAGMVRSIENILMSPRDRSSGYAALLASTPVTAPFGWPQLNFLGDPVRDVTAHGRALNSGLPVLLQTAEVDPVYQLIGDKMVAPTTLRRSDMERALQTRFTEEQWYAITALYGGTLKELIMDNFDTLYDMDSTEASKLMNQLSKEAKEQTLSEFE